MWRVLHACAAAETIIIMQAANTGLTGGSTPYGQDYDRPIVIVNTLRLAKIHCCLPISLSRFGVADSAEIERWGGHCHGA